MVSKDEDCEYSDLDQFESEMQTMLSFTLRRMKNLNNEVHGLNSWQEKTKLVSSPSTVINYTFVHYITLNFR